MHEQPLSLTTTGGPVECRYAPAQAACAVLWVGGAGGGWDTPARDLYPRLIHTLHDVGIASLRVRYRHPNHLSECTQDVLAGLAFLQQEGILRVALTGHSFGGAVVIQAASRAPQIVKTVVTLSTQSYGVAPVSQLDPLCSILLVHGERDYVLTPDCSRYTYDIAHEPKRLVLYPNADHGLDEVRDDLFDTVYAWITQELNCAQTSSSTSSAAAL